MLNEKQIKIIARACHEVNKSWCELNGDESQVAWTFAPEWQHETVIKGVTKVLADGVENASPEDSHKAWLADKEADGWVYGPVKDPEKKTHPCMVPYADLPKKDQLKDALFLSVVFILSEALKEVRQ